MLETLKQGRRSYADIPPSSKTPRILILISNCVNALKENRAVLIGSGMQVTISQLQNTPKCARENGKAGFGVRTTPEYVWDLLKIVQKDGMSTLIKLLNETLACTCAPACSFLKASFQSASSAYVPSYAFLSCLSPVCNDSGYFERKIRRKLQQIVSFSSFYGKEKNIFIWS